MEGHGAISMRALERTEVMEVKWVGKGGMKRHGLTRYKRCILPATAAEKRGLVQKSGTHRRLQDYKQAEGWIVLAVSNRRWKLADDQFGVFLEHYVSDMPRFNLGLVVKKSEYFPYIMDVDKSATKGASVGSPMEVLKVVVRALKSVVGETSILFEHRNSANFHVLCPSIIVNSRTAVRVREKQLAVLTLEHPEVDWGDIVDEKVLTSNGLRLLGSLKYKEITGARDRTKRYKEVEADIAGGCYVPCQIDLESGCVRDEAMTYEALSARLLHRPELTEADLFKLPCERWGESETYKYLADFKITRPTCMTLTTEDKTGWRLEDTAVRQGFYEKYLTEAEQFDFQGAWPARAPAGDADRSVMPSRGSKIRPSAPNNVRSGRHPTPHEVRQTTCPTRTADQVLLRLQRPDSAMADRAISMRTMKSAKSDGRSGYLYGSFQTARWTIGLSL